MSETVAPRIFAFEDLAVRVSGTPEEPLFVLADVCRVLDIRNAKQSADSLDPDDVCQTYTVDSLGRRNAVIAITESGLYTLLVRSDKPKAKPFRRWVTKEVLPSIRKTGTYSIGDGGKWDHLWKAFMVAKSSGLQRELLGAMRLLPEAPSTKAKQHAQVPADLTLETFWKAALYAVHNAVKTSKPAWLKLELTSKTDDSSVFFGTLWAARDSMINAVVSINPTWSFYSTKDYESLLAREQNWVQPANKTFQNPGQPERREIFWGFYVSAAAQPQWIAEICGIIGNMKLP